MSDEDRSFKGIKMFVAVEHEYDSEQVLEVIADALKENFPGVSGSGMFGEFVLENFRPEGFADFWDGRIES